MVLPTSVQQPVGEPNIDAEVKSQTEKERSEIGYKLITELMKNAKVVDNRSNFF
ncbi:MAG: hypothetical protein R2771_01515 [Saprospiraceae bacterium]